MLPSTCVGLKSEILSTSAALIHYKGSGFRVLGLGSTIYGIYKSFVTVGRSFGLRQLRLLWQGPGFRLRKLQF